MSPGAIDRNVEPPGVNGNGLQRGKKTRRAVMRAAITGALCMIAGSCPILSAEIVRLAGGGTASEFLNAGSVTALLITPLVALRTGQLRDLLFGPTFALVAGFLDLKAMVWLYAVAGCSLAVAGTAPVWGATLASWTASTRRSWRGRVLVFLAIVIADAAGRVLWMTLGAIVVLDHHALAEWRWLLEGLAYSPAAILIVLLAARG